MQARVQSCPRKDLRFFGDCALRKWPLRGSRGNQKPEIECAGGYGYLSCMPDQLSDQYADLLTGTYDCVDRIIVNAYFPKGVDDGGFRCWWRALHGSDENLDNDI